MILEKLRLKDFQQIAHWNQGRLKDVSGISETVSSFGSKERFNFKISY